MMTLAQLLPFALASALVIGVPGPATFFVLGQAQVSRRHAARATLGIVLGDVLLMTASLLLAVKLGGAAYLVHLAWGATVLPKAYCLRSPIPSLAFFPLFQGAEPGVFCDPGDG